MNEHKIRRNPDGSLVENCPENIGFKVGSFDCTANCQHNQNTKKEIQEQAFDLTIVRCEKLKINNQIKIEL